MTHGECIATIAQRPQRSAGRVRQAAAKHVARCSDCWAILVGLHELTTGRPPEHSDRMSKLYGCHDVTDRLHLLVGLSAADIDVGHPTSAAHLRWCHACRRRLAEMVRVEGAAAAAGVSPTWRAVHDTFRKLLVRIGTGVREAAAAFTAVPDGVHVMPVRAAGALRGQAVTEELYLRALRIPLKEWGTVAELRLDAEGADRVGLVLRFSGAPHGALTVSVRSVDPHAGSAFGRFTVRGAEPVALKGLATGSYVLEIFDKDQAHTFQMSVDIAPKV